MGEQRKIIDHVPTADELALRELPIAPVRRQLTEGEIATAAAEAAAVRPPKAESEGDKVRTRTIQQMGVDAADRAIRARNGLPPRTANLT
ncbi:MAG TPA: hypothetical protein PKB09_02910 [Candidatus Saccharibacteria bacterium]|nr:hypothetical protein [Candidatus Saccharibacteria bacterium]